MRKYFYLRQLRVLTTAVLMISVTKAAVAQTPPMPKPIVQTIIIPCGKKHVSAPPKTGLQVPQGFLGGVRFTIKAPAGRELELVGPVTWIYPGRGAGDHNWGAWTTGQKTRTLKWTPPAVGNGYFTVSVSGKARCKPLKGGGGMGGGGGGQAEEEFTFAAVWTGTVTAEWKAQPNIGMVGFDNTKIIATRDGVELGSNNAVYPGQKINVKLGFVA